MKSPEYPIGVWRFGAAEFNETEAWLTVGSVPKELDRSGFAMLACLLRRAGEVVAKDDLLLAGWPGRIVSENALTKSIARLRQALSDGEGDLLRTVHGYGYRLTGKVEFLPVLPFAGRALDEEATGAKPDRRNPIMPSRPSVAVLPFTNLSADPAQDYFSDGITESIITNLSRFRDLFVIARNSSFAYKGRVVRVQDICLELGVRYIVEGGIQKSGDRIRINTRLIDGLTGGHLWAEQYDRQMVDIFEVQDEVTEMIVGTLATGYGGRLNKAWQGRAKETDEKEKSFQAIDYFLQGMQAFDQLTKDEVQRAGDLFQKAVDIDPNYSKALAKLAWVHIIHALDEFGDDVSESWACAKKFASMAIERDDDEAWGHWAMAAYYLYRRQHDRAIAELTRALDLNPNDADIISDFALHLSYDGQAQNAIEMAHKAMRLNPHGPHWYAMQLGQIYFNARRYEDALAKFEEIQSQGTIWIPLYVAASHAALGHAAEAGSAIQQVLGLDPQATIKKWITDEKTPYKDPNHRAHLRNNLFVAGLPE